MAALEPNGKRTIIIVGENHTEKHITNAKLLSLPASLDVVLFIENTKSKTFLTNKGEKIAIPISTELPSTIEGIFQIFTFLAIFKTYGNGKLQAFNLTPSQAIAIVSEMYNIDLSNEEVVANPTQAFNTIKRKLIEVCSNIQGNDYGINAYINSDEFSYDTLTSTFNENPAFASSYKLVDDAIIANIHQHHTTTPPNVAFVIVVGNGHVANIIDGLQSPNYNIVKNGGTRTRYRKRNARNKKRKSRKFK
jgi:hypothetical protein